MTCWLDSLCNFCICKLVFIVFLTLRIRCILHPNFQSLMLSSISKTNWMIKLKQISMLFHHIIKRKIYSKKRLDAMLYMFVILIYAFVYYLRTLHVCKSLLQWYQYGYRLPLVYSNCALQFIPMYPLNTMNNLFVSPSIYFLLSK